MSSKKIPPFLAATIYGDHSDYVTTPFENGANQDMFPMGFLPPPPIPPQFEQNSFDSNDFPMDYLPPPPMPPQFVQNGPDQNAFPIDYLPPPPIPPQLQPNPHDESAFPMDYLPPPPIPPQYLQNGPEQTVFPMDYLPPPIPPQLYPYPSRAEESGGLFPDFLLPPPPPPPLLQNQNGSMMGSPNYVHTIHISPLKLSTSKRSAERKFKKRKEREPRIRKRKNRESKDRKSKIRKSKERESSVQRSEVRKRSYENIIEKVPIKDEYRKESICDFKRRCHAYIYSDHYFRNEKLTKKEILSTWTSKRAEVDAQLQPHLNEISAEEKREILKCDQILAIIAQAERAELDCLYEFKREDQGLYDSISHAFNKYKTKNKGKESNAKEFIIQMFPHHAAKDFDLPLSLGYESLLDYNYHVHKEEEQEERKARGQCTPEKSSKIREKSRSRSRSPPNYDVEVEYENVTLITTAAKGKESEDSRKTRNDIFKNAIQQHQAERGMM